MNALATSAPLPPSTPAGLVLVQRIGQITQLIQRGRYDVIDMHSYESATNITAKVTKMLLEGGRRFCFLFTDLANPTSNSIYYAVGYRPVTDVDMWAFKT